MRKFLLPILAVVLVSCAGLTLDTTNKRFAAFEVSYKSALVEIDQLNTAGSLKPETKVRVAAALDKVNTARSAAYVAKGTGNLGEAQNQLGLAIQALEYLKTITPKDAKI